MKLELTDKEGNVEITDMEYDNQGVWYLRLRGNYEGCKYRYIKKYHFLYLYKKFSTNF